MTHFTGIELGLILFGAWLLIALFLVALLSLFIRFKGPRDELSASWIDKPREDEGV